MVRGKQEVLGDILMKKIVETIKDVLIPELISIAKDTPKSWGEIILKRNTALLNKLELFKPYIGMRPSDLSSEKIELIIEHVRFGCPHCDHVDMRCGKCLWTKHAKNIIDQFGLGSENACLRVPFNKISYNELREYPLDVLYYKDEACMHINYYAGTITLENYQEAENFLKGHIEWAKYIIENGLEG